MVNETGFSIATLIILTSGIMAIMAGTIILFTVQYQRKMIWHKHKFTLLESEKKIELYKATAEMQEQERERIAKDLHDEIGPLLTALRINYNIHSLRADEKLKEKLKADLELIDNSTNGIRRICNDLSPSLLNEFGFFICLENFTKTINSEGVIINLKNDVEDLQTLFTEKQHLALYRICHEVLNNLLKHTQAQTINIQCIKNGAIHVNFSHDGCCISNEDVVLIMNKNVGLGLKSIQSRLLSLNGNIDYLTTGNTKIKLSIPLIYA